MKIRILTLGIALLFILACTQDRTVLNDQLDADLRDLIRDASPDGTVDFYVLPSENDLDAIPQDPKNPLTSAKVNLGKFLFFETALAQDAIKSSGMGTYSCATCHVPEAGFKPGSFQGIADGGSGYGINGESRYMNTEYVQSELDVQSARPLTMVNVAYVTNTFWNGQFGATGINVGTEHLWDNNEDTERNHQGFEGIETQNFEGLISHRISINKPLLDSLGYTEMFDTAFADIDETERYTQRTASFAFSAYIRTILSNKAPFQDWLRGNSSALSYDQKLGAELFFGKALCTNCHYNENLGSLEFHALGAKDMYQRQQGAFNAFPDDKRNLGRGGFTLEEADNFKFKVPGIYNAEETSFLFHGASIESLEELIDYKNLALTENPNVLQEKLSPDFLPLQLNQAEKLQLVDFIRNGLKDPDLIRYKPLEVLSGNCFPNNDPQSLIDLGCN